MVVHYNSMKNKSCALSLAVNVYAESVSCELIASVS